VGLVAELDSQPKTVQSIYSWFAEGKLFVNRRYQRKLVWTQNEKQKLVESVLRKYPVPAILLAERDEGGYEIIDGLQRLHTLVSFIENAFPTLDGRFFDVFRFPTAQGRADEGKFELLSDPACELLTTREVSTFLDYSLAISVMRGSTEDEIDDVFARINTYGHRLSDQERRQAGVQDEFSNLVRQLACEFRGDASSDVLGLAQMPSISVDLPMTRHGYDVIADEVFWVKQGILRSTDLRDSMDEQCLADISASIIGGQIVDRSKDALDNIYQAGNPENARIIAALDVYGGDKFSSELKYCVDELLNVCAAGGSAKLRNIIFTKPSTNPFPAVFTILMLALHESLIGNQKRIANYSGIKKAISGLYDRIDTSRKSTAPDERRKNVDTVKGLIAACLVDGELRDVYGAHSTTDIDNSIRRSEIELPHYELKQGLLRLGESREADPDVLAKVICTICAIANNGKGRAGQILIGVTDKDADASRIRSLDGVEPRRVGSRFVVGVRREASLLGEKPEDYFARWKHAIRNSTLSQPLRDSVLSSMDYHDYYGLGLIVITIPAQKTLSVVDEDAYWRDGDETVKAAGAVKVGELAMRFS
jgi:hypothetical protein